MISLEKKILLWRDTMKTKDDVGPKKKKKQKPT